jgi:plasmid stabilization system protein ParE
VKLRLRITRRAAADIERADAWWRENRLAAPWAIRVDLRSALDLLAVQPGIGQKVENARVAGTRRLHLDRVRYHLYYRVAEGELVVLAFWHSNRGAQPRV